MRDGNTGGKARIRGRQLGWKQPRSQASPGSLLDPQQASFPWVMCYHQELHMGRDYHHHHAVAPRE